MKDGFRIGITKISGEPRKSKKTVTKVTAY
jgi:hypothetical protein